MIEDISWQIAPSWGNMGSNNPVKETKNMNSINLHTALAQLIVDHGAFKVRTELDYVASQLVSNLTSGQKEVAQATISNTPAAARSSQATAKAVKKSVKKAAPVKAATPGKRKLSDEARARIVEAQRKRWAKVKGEAAPAKKARKAGKSAATPVAKPVENLEIPELQPSTEEVNTVAENLVSEASEATANNLEELFNS